MRRILWKWHGWLGLLCAIPLFIIALSGSLLVFKAEIDHWLMPEVVNASGDTRLSFTQQVNAADKALPEHEILAWEFATKAGDADKLYVAKHGTYDWEMLYADPSNGQLLSEPVSFTHYFTDWMLELHHSLLIDHEGLVVTGITSILLVLLSISGFILHRQFWRTFFTLRWNKSLRLFLSDGHKMLGIIGAPLFLIFGFTGAWWNVDHIIDEWNEPDQAQFIITQAYYNKHLDYDSLLTAASESIDNFQANFVRFPDKSYPGIHLFGAATDKGVLRSDFGSIVSFDDQTGKLIGTLDVAKSSALYQFTDSFKPLHYGNFGGNGFIGVVIKIIWCVIGFLPCLMALSGYIMWQKRRKPQKAKRERKPQTATA